MKNLNTDFENYFNLVGHVKRINSQEALHMQVGEVALVYSENVPELGKHFIVVTGHPVVKEHGLRPQTMEFKVNGISVADNYTKEHGVIILKLQKAAAEAFLNYHGIKVEKNNLILT